MRSRIIYFFPLIAFCVLSLGACNSTPATKSPTTNSWRFALCDYYCALVDANGSLVVNRLFKSVQSFNGPLATYNHDDKQGVIDRNGRTLVKPEDGGRALQALGDARAPKFWITAKTIKTGAQADTRLYTLYDGDGAQIWTRSYTGASYFYLASYGYVAYHQFACDAACGPEVILGKSGIPIRRFASLSIPDHEGLTAATLDGKHFGYVDSSLNFIIEPVFFSANAFSHGVAQVQTESGPALIDRKGKYVVPPERYTSIFRYLDKPLMHAYRAGRQCGELLTAAGRKLDLPDDVCPDIYDQSHREFGYSIVRNGADKAGIIDLAGRVLTDWDHAKLRPLNRDYVTYSDVRETSFVGVADIHGRRILPAQFRFIRSLQDRDRHDLKAPSKILFAATSDGGGVIDTTGKWLIPPIYQDGYSYDNRFIAMEPKADHKSDGYPLFRTNGTLLFTSKGIISRLRTGENAPAFFLVGPYDQRGLVNPDGKLIIPERYKEIDSLGEKLWKVGLVDSKTHLTQWGIYDSDGQKLSQEIFSEINSFHGGRAVALDANYKHVLIDRQGTVLARMSTLFPDDSSTRDEITDEASQLLDVCYVADPTAEPEDQPSRKGGLRRVCENHKLASLSHNALLTYYTTQSNGCVPEKLVGLRTTYDARLQSATSDTDITAAIDEFRSAITQASSQCDAHVANQPLKSVSAELQQKLRRVLLSSGSGPDQNEEGFSLHFNKLPDSDRPIVLAESTCDLCSAYAGSTFWLLVQEPGGKWRVALSGDGYPSTVIDQRGTVVGLAATQRENAARGWKTYFSTNHGHYTKTLDCGDFAGPGDTVLTSCSRVVAPLQ